MELSRVTIAIRKISFQQILIYSCSLFMLETINDGITSYYTVIP